MDIRKSLEVDLFGNVIAEKKSEQVKPDLLFKTALIDIPSRPYSVHRISPTEVWIIHDDKKPLPV